MCDKVESSEQYQVSTKTNTPDDWNLFRALDHLKIKREQILKQLFAIEKAMEEVNKV